MKWQESIFLISRIRENIQLFLIRELEKRDMNGLAPTHGDIINALRKNKSLTMTELADKISRDRSTVTTLVEKLVRTGFVCTSVNPADKRSSLVSLTEKGVATEEDFNEISELMFDKMFKNINNEEREQWANVLGTIFNNFQD